MTKTIKIKEKLEQHKVEIINLYIVENKTQVQIAEQFGTSQSNIYKFLKRHGIKKQRKTVPPKTNTIKTIGNNSKLKYIANLKLTIISLWEREEMALKFELIFQSFLVRAMP
ncbi:helix-turn-helix domain-containing protein [Lactococcus garvieae]|uniref:Uncharacterized protein n=1 Tax=Lactococcus garvieae TaxID=1363 RepID=A0A1I4FCG1_9LACT|nr:helix-turn-helix domain-containing protein [Lactococcus garvieae]SFL15163.1 hypothetical protein SAMN05216438_101550 [Lactococcus garvieae]